MSAPFGEFSYFSAVKKVNAMGAATYSLISKLQQRGADYDPNSYVRTEFVGFSMGCHVVHKANQFSTAQNKPSVKPYIFNCK